MGIITKIKENLQLVLTIAAVAGLVVGIINFFILTAVTPIAEDVKASEERITKLEEGEKDEKTLVLDFNTFREKVNSIETKISVIPDMMKSISRIEGKLDK